MMPDLVAAHLEHALDLLQRGRVDTAAAELRRLLLAYGHKPPPRPDLDAPPPAPRKRRPAPTDHPTPPPHAA